MTYFAIDCLSCICFSVKNSVGKLRKMGHVCGSDLEARQLELVRTLLVSVESAKCLTIFSSASISPRAHLHLLLVV